MAVAGQPVSAVPAAGLWEGRRASAAPLRLVFLMSSVFSHKLTVLEACFDFTSGLFGGQFPGWWLGFVRRNTSSRCLPVDGSSRHGLDPLTLRGCGKLSL